MTTELQLTSVKPSWVPHEYQERAISLLLAQASGGLFLDPGLGKTSICLATFKILKKLGYVRKMLIIAPLQPMMVTWSGEIEKWLEFQDLTYTVLHGPSKRENLKLDADIYLINPEGLLWLFDQQRTLPVAWDILVVDESTKFSNSTSKRFKLLKPFVERFSRRWILTGTPSPQGLESLFGQIYLLDSGRALGRYITHFREQFFQRSGFSIYDWAPRPGSFEKVVGKIKPLVIQLSAEEYLKMPKLVYIDKEVNLPPKAMAMYREFDKELIVRVGDADLVAANEAVLTGKLKQIANGAVYDADKNVIEIHEEKLDMLESILSELSGKPALVLYEYDHDRTRILRRLQGVFGDNFVRYIRSGVSREYVSETVSRFNAGELQCLLGHPASMGHGLNLQGSCYHVIFFGPPWSIDFFDQPIARVYRQGQQADSVFVYTIIAKGTKDERAIEVLEKADRTQQDLLKALA